MERVLIPTDFSDCANHAANIGLELAKKLNSEVSFLHLINTPVDWSKLSLDKETLYPETKTAIGDAKDGLLKLERRAEKLGVEANSLLLFNQGVEEIQNYISKEKYCLVVMGTHGEKGMGKFIGSNTQRVLKHSPVPVLSVKQSDKPAPFKKIGIASDFQKESLKSFRDILKLAKNFGLEIEVVYVNTPYTFMESNQIEKAMDVFLKEETNVKERRFIYNAKNEERGIGMYIATEKPDIIATITRQHSDLEKIFRPGVTESIINHFNLPVLSINQRK